MNSEEILNLTTIFANIATFIGLPAILWQLREEARNRNVDLLMEIDGDLTENYNEIMVLFIENPELDSHDSPLADEQDAKRQYRIYEMLISFFEKAHLRLAHEKNQTLKRLWNSWEDYIEEWLQKPNFQNALERLLKGEDPKFIAYMRKKAASVALEAAEKTPEPEIL